MYSVPKRVELRERLELGDTLTCLRQSLNLMQFQVTSVLGMQYRTNLYTNIVFKVQMTKIYIPVSSL